MAGVTCVLITLNDCGLVSLFNAANASNNVLVMSLHLCEINWGLCPLYFGHLWNHTHFKMEPGLVCILQQNMVSLPQVNTIVQETTTFRDLNCYQPLCCKVIPYYFQWHHTCQCGWCSFIFQSSGNHFKPNPISTSRNIFRVKAGV